MVLAACVRAEHAFLIYFDCALSLQNRVFSHIFYKHFRKHFSHVFARSAMIAMVAPSICVAGACSDDERHGVAQRSGRSPKGKAGALKGLCRPARRASVLRRSRGYAVLLLPPPEWQG